MNYGDLKPGDLLIFDLGDSRVMTTIMSIEAGIPETWVDVCGLRVNKTSDKFIEARMRKDWSIARSLLPDSEERVRVIRNGHVFLDEHARTTL
jgi:hypothetical protein